MPIQSEHATADQNACQWNWSADQPMPIGSDSHRDATCRMFRETFNPYKTSSIQTPKLDPDALRRLTSLPIWHIAVSMETKAHSRMIAYSEAVADPAWRRAIRHNGWEAGRHRECLTKLVTSFGMRPVSQPHSQRPEDPECGYLITGFAKYVDSFLAFGLFEIARRSGFFPTALADILEPLIQEEVRHILLFANWLAWHRKHLGVYGRLRFEYRVVCSWIFVTWNRINLLRGNASVERPDTDLTPDAHHDRLSRLLDVLAICLTENDRRFTGYDQRLLRPGSIPALTRLALRTSGMLRQRRTPKAVEPPARNSCIQITHT